MQVTGLLLVGHGTRDRKGQAEFFRLVSWPVIRAWVQGLNRVAGNLPLPMDRVSPDPVPPPVVGRLVVRTVDERSSPHPTLWVSIFRASSFKALNQKGCPIRRLVIRRGWGA